MVFGFAEKLETKWLRRNVIDANRTDICERIQLIKPSGRSERSDWTLERAGRVDTGLSTVPVL
jgi:N-formylglutamate amidohydrolase